MDAPPASPPLTLELLGAGRVLRGVWDGDVYVTLHMVHANRDGLPISREASTEIAAYIAGAINARVLLVEALEQLAWEPFSPGTDLLRRCRLCERGEGHFDGCQVGEALQALTAAVPAVQLR